MSMFDDEDGIDSDQSKSMPIGIPLFDGENVMYGDREGEAIEEILEEGRREILSSNTIEMKIDHLVNNEGYDEEMAVIKIISELCVEVRAIYGTDHTITFLKRAISTLESLHEG